MIRTETTTILRVGLTACLGLTFTLGGVGASVSAKASTPGEVCLFNAPSGAPIKLPNGTVIRPGHIGWGFRNGTGDSWTFGATEDAGGRPIIGSGNGAKAASQSWHETGHYADMLHAFGIGLLHDADTNTTYTDGPGYYTRFRCSDVLDGNPGNALTQAQNGEKSGYNFLLDNCLTKAVAILDAYGMPGLLPAISTAPNFYFTNELPSPSPSTPGFSGQQYFTTVTITVDVIDPQDNQEVNQHPLHTQRPMRILVFDQSGQPVYESDFSHFATVAPNSDRYTATLQLPTDSPLHQAVWSSGSNPSQYVIQVQLMFTKFTDIAQPVNIQQGVNNVVPGVTQVTPGDINGDNSVDIQDYNLLLDCFSDISPPKGPCDSAQKTAADINDDGNVNGFDYNLLLRVFASQIGK